jgi:type IV pilus assembly protein PilF
MLCYRCPMTRCFLALTIFALSACSSTQSADKARAQLHLQIGVSHLAQGNNPAALAELMRAEELDSDNAVIKNNLGLAYYIRGKLEMAEKKFHEALRIDRKFSDARNNLGRLLIDRKKYQEAIKELTIVEDDLTYQNPEKVFSNLGMAHFELGNYHRAETYLNKSLDLRRESCVTASFFGRTLLELKRYAQSAEILDKAIEYCREAKFEDPLFFSAMSYYSLGETEKSRARLEELLRDHPKTKYFAKAKGMLELLQP